MWYYLLVLLCGSTVSHMYYDIIQGFVRGYIAVLVGKVLGGSRLVYQPIKG
jgi:hypothetical protein